MQVFNVRFGLATNSSSSHSLIFLKDGIKALDYNGDHRDVNDELIEFGWQHFTAASREMKMRYLGILLRDRLIDSLPEHIATLVCKDWLDGLDIDGGYIDHQSWYALPNEFGAKTPDKEFFEHLKRYYLQERMVILGGNDNTSAKHTLDDGTSFKLPLDRDCGRRSGNVCRYDPEYNYWSVFDTETGRKVRFRFDNDPTKMVVVPEKAFAPELVDIKITNYCPFGCEFCYQSSTTKGKHADGYKLYSLAIALAKLKVFEVALGGGEPTLYDNFETVLKYFRETGIVPNFTTKNLAWLRDPKKWQKIMELAGAFAYSVTRREEIEELGLLLDYNGIARDRANLHVVMGTIDIYAFGSLLRAANDQSLSMTLLGYKSHGFGKDYKPIPYPWWLDEVKEAAKDRTYGASIAIDTVIAKEYEKEILEADVPNYLFTTKEGKFSCYIDAVAMKMGPSSFCPEDQLIALDDENIRQRADSDRIREIFATF
jgi:hypothetical protein